MRTAVFSGFVVFLWKMFSWMVLPFHMMTFNSFTNERQMADLFRENAPQSGVYMMPSMNTPADMQQSMPCVFTSINWDHMGSHMTGSILLSLLAQVFIAYFIAWLLAQSKTSNLKAKVRFVVCVALVGGLLHLLPGWIWVGYSFAYVVVNLLDLTIGWFLGGLVMAKTLK